MFQEEHAVSHSAKAKADRIKIEVRRIYCFLLTYPQGLKDLHVETVQSLGNVRFNILCIICYFILIVCFVIC